MGDQNKRVFRGKSAGRKLLVSHQVHTAQQALQQAFEPSSPRDDVLFYLPVTKAWLRQLVLALVLICHSSYRGVVELLADLFDYSMSLGNVHNIVRSAMPQARWINQQYDLSAVGIGTHDEIFQASDPVLVGVDTASTFCYLLSWEEHRDAETWGIRLLELVDRGFAPQAIVADGGSGLRAGQKLALSDVPCRGDHFHLIREFESAAGCLERRAYQAIDACEQRQHEQRRQERRGKPLHSPALRLRSARAACDPAIKLFDDVSFAAGLAPPGHTRRGWSELCSTLHAVRLRGGRTSVPRGAVPGSAPADPSVAEERPGGVSRLREGNRRKPGSAGK